MIELVSIDYFFPVLLEMPEIKELLKKNYDDPDNVKQRLLAENLDEKYLPVIDLIEEYVNENALEKTLNMSSDPDYEYWVIHHCFGPIYWITVIEADNEQYFKSKADYEEYLKVNFL